MRSEERFWNERLRRGLSPGAGRIGMPTNSLREGEAEQLCRRFDLAAISNIVSAAPCRLVALNLSQQFRLANHFKILSIHPFCPAPKILLYSKQLLDWLFLTA